MDVTSDTSPAIELVLVGHVGFTEQITPFGTGHGIGGSGYACAIGAGVGRQERIGLVAHIGDDFDVSWLYELGVDLEGVVAVPGKSPWLKIIEHTPAERSFVGDLGVACKAATDVFPNRYAHARHIHLATIPPSEQLIWVEAARSLGCTVSVDMFELWANECPEISRRLAHAADLVFMNEREYRLLFAAHPLPLGCLIIKNGARGACIRNVGRWTHVPAPSCKAVDTTGAGEVLAGSFLALRELGLTSEVSLAYAVRLASAKVVEFGFDGHALEHEISTIRSAVTRAIPT